MSSRRVGGIGGRILCLVVLCVWPVETEAQVRTEPAAVECPSVLGIGRLTGFEFCDVMTGNDATQGIRVVLPPRQGDVTLSFDLHNRHTYSEELIRAGRGYRRYTATIGVLTPNNDLLTRAIVQNEFRSAADLEDRIGGGAGPGGVKAIAPTGTVRIVVTISDNLSSISILGEKLEVVRTDAADPDNFNAPGRPIAIISNVLLQYRPR
jgi:hypothetical protein